MKKSFTLIEVLLSIVILSILMLGISNVIKQLNFTQKFLKNNYQKNIVINRTIKLLYYDILCSNKVIIKQQNGNTILLLKTSNSLYKIVQPYVIWYLSLKNSSLIRVETPKNPIQKSSKFFVLNSFYVDKFLDDVSIFEIYRNKDKFFVYFKNKIPYFFELYK